MLVRRRVVDIKLRLFLYVVVVVVHSSYIEMEHGTGKTTRTASDTNVTTGCAESLRPSDRNGIEV